MARPPLPHRLDVAPQPLAQPAPLGRLAPTRRAGGTVRRFLADLALIAAALSAILSAIILTGYHHGG